MGIDKNFTKLVYTATTNGQNRFKFACYVDNSLLYDFDIKDYVNYSKVIKYEILPIIE